MKIGVSSYSFMSFIQQRKNAGLPCDYFLICDKAKEIGFEGIEFVNLDWCGLCENEIETAEQIKNYCEKIGLEIIAYTVGANLLAEDTDKEVQRLKHCVDVAEKLGAPLMRHDAFNSLKKPFNNYCLAINKIVPIIREITEYAKQKGIRTCTENHGFIIQAPERVEELILAVNNENYGWLVDIGNFLCADAEPAKSTAIAVQYAFHVHAKDFLVKSGDDKMPQGYSIITNAGNYLRGTVVGHGDVPIGKCINALKKGGYNGWISVEFEGPEETISALQNGFENLKYFIETR